MLGLQGVNAYVDPVVSLDLDVVIAVDPLAEIERGSVKILPSNGFLTVSTSSQKARICDSSFRRIRATKLFLPNAVVRDVLGY